MPAARSRLWVIAAQIAPALLAANRLEGGWARGPSIRSANTVSMMACRRWRMSSAAVGSRLLVKNRRYRQTGNSSASLARSRTRRTISRAVTGCRVEASAVNATSADLGVTDQLAGCRGRPPHRVMHRCPRLVGSGGDRAGHRGGLGQHQREPGFRLEVGTDYYTVAVGRVATDEDLAGAGGGGTGHPDRVWTPHPLPESPGRRGAGSRPPPAPPSPWRWWSPAATSPCAAPASRRSWCARARTLLGVAEHRPASARDPWTRTTKSSTS